jgi:hypothetical protein
MKMKNFNRIKKQYIIFFLTILPLGLVFYLHRNRESELVINEQVIHEECLLADDYQECFRLLKRKRKLAIKNPRRRADEIIEQINTLSAEQGIRNSDLYIKSHLELLHIYWRYIAKDRNKNLPEVKMLSINDTFSGCGKLKAIDYPNVYCMDGSNEMYVDIKPLLEALPQKKSRDLDEMKLEVVVLAHEMGHHMNFYSGRGPYKGKEEDAADWRAGQYLTWLLKKGAFDLNSFVNGANLFFSIGDFHQQTLHNNPKGRFKAFVKGVELEKANESLFVGDWEMDTPETFSKLMKREYQGSNFLINAEVYRFEIDRTNQIAGNILNAVIGTSICLSGAERACQSSLMSQGKSKPEGWYAQRNVEINCTENSFDITGDKFKHQELDKDETGQMKLLANKYCDR